MNKLGLATAVSAVGLVLGQAACAAGDDMGTGTQASSGRMGVPANSKYWGLPPYWAFDTPYGGGYATGPRGAHVVTGVGRTGSNEGYVGGERVETPAPAYDSDSTRYAPNSSEYNSPEPESRIPAYR